tara:strand:+ start:627 stop:1340 length:714 start_codon:yes stop_codon:yes gene_type:complete
MHKKLEQMLEKNLRGNAAHDAFGKVIKSAVHTSSRCQRNWNLNKKIPIQDLNVIETALTACPSKQNYIFYKPYMITHRETIDKIYHCTSDGSNNWPDGKPQLNPQCLAQLLIVFTWSDEYIKQVESDNIAHLYRNDEVKKEIESGKEHPNIDFQRVMSIGLAAGYVNLAANMLGYRTGCCTCFDPQAVGRIIKSSGRPILLMGVGIADENRPRREHHKDHNVIFPSHDKTLESIKVA